MSRPYVFKHFLICISGFSGSGKDEFSKVFVEEMRAPKVGLADPAKRHMADLYGFTERQLYGASANRNAGDLRYPKPEMEKVGLTISRVSSQNVPEGLVGTLHPDVVYWEFEARQSGPEMFPYVPGRLGSARIFVPEGNSNFWLSPREALQRYCELMNLMYGDTWIRKSVNTHVQLGQTIERNGSRFMIYAYDRMIGIMRPDEAHSIPAPEDGGSFFSCSSDFRHVHEFRMARKLSAPDFLPVSIRVKRPSVPGPPFPHRSETEQATIPDEFFDFVIDNDGTTEELHAKAREVIARVQEKGWAPRRWSL
jgi:hypothetical protein